MVKYFRYFPRITYKKAELVDISRKANIIEKFKNDPYAFLPYTIEGNDRPEDIAYHYYGDMQYTWLVYLANGIIDPYNEWPKTDAEFDRYIIKQYEKKSGKKGFEVLTWAQNETIQDNILYYYKKSDRTNHITVDTYNLGASIENFVQGEWSPMRVYDYELEKDNEKRSIYLVNQIYVEQMDEELRKVLNNES